MRISYLPFQPPVSEPPPAAPPPPAPFFNCSRRAERGGLIRLLLCGELDLLAVPRFRAALAEAQGDSDRVLLDLTALTLIDCAALAVLYAAAARRRREGAALIFLAPGGQVRRVLELVGMPDGVTVVDSGDLPEIAVPVAS